MKIFKPFSTKSTLILAVLMIWVIVTGNYNRNEINKVKVLPHKGFKAPQFELNTLTGQKVRLADYIGSPVIINFWASWCTPCRTEMPDLNRVYEKYRDQGLEILAVNVTRQDELGNVEKFIDDGGYSFTVLLDQDGAVQDLYRVRALPSTYLIDKSGKIMDVIYGGPIPPAVLEAKMDELLSRGQ